jgi:hypothetical protein
MTAPRRSAPGGGSSRGLEPGARAAGLSLGCGSGPALKRILRLALPRGPALSGVALFGWTLVVACGPRAMPDPRDAARAYARAAAAGDADALYEMMTSEGRQSHGREGVQRLVEETRPELERRSQSLSRGPLVAEARAELGYADGEVAVLELEEGTFRVGAAATLPAGATTPQQALVELRRALAQRSYATLSRALADGTRRHLEDQLSSLVRSLEDPEAADVSIQGDRATVTLPEGHLVSLRREQGVWKVEDFR